jgi:hypothetical protein
MSKHGEHKRGDTREDGRIFLRYDRFGNEYWYEKEKYRDIIKKIKSASKLYKKIKRKELSLKNKIYRLNNKERIDENRKKYYQKNNRRIYDVHKKLLLRKPLAKFKIRIRNLISTTIRRKSFSKGSKTNEILGCTFEELKIHIESLFYEGMNWDNYGEWHIDHIMPASMAKTYDEVVRLNHYKNLRPMWASDNLRKSDKIGDTLVLF